MDHLWGVIPVSMMQVIKTQKVVEEDRSASSPCQVLFETLWDIV